MDSQQEKTNPIKTLLMISLVVLFLLFISVLTIFTSNKTSTIEPDQKSRVV